MNVAYLYASGGRRGLRDGHLRVRGWVKVTGYVEVGQALGRREDDSGKGALRLANGSVLSGLWKSGQLRQDIEFKLPEGSIWNDLEI